MTWAELATLALKQVPWADSINVDSTSLYNYLNLSYHEIENAIVQNINEEYFYQEITFDIVANQWEYTEDVEIRGNTSGTNKVTSVEIDYNGSGTYREATITGADNISEKRTSSSTLYPLFRNIDRGIEIYPTPLQSVAWGGRMRVVQNLIDITSGTTEANIFNGKIHKNNHTFIAFGARSYILQHLGRTEEAQVARQQFLTMLFGDGRQDIGLIWRLDNRTIGTMKSKEPNTSYFN